MKQTALFQIHSDVEEETFLQVVDDGVCIGKGASVDVKLEDWRVSGIHALIKKDDKKGFVVIDLGSYFGTYLNRKKINYSKFEEGDVLEIGGDKLVLRGVDIAREKGIVKNIDDACTKVHDEKYLEGLVTERSVLEVKLFWGSQILEIKNFDVGDEISIGNPKNSTFGMVLEDRPGEESYKLAKYVNGELKLNVPQEAGGIIWSDNKTYALDALRHYSEEHAGKDILDLTIRVGDQAHVEFGEMALDFNFIVPPKKIPRKFAFTLNQQLKKIILGILGFYLLIFLLLALLDKDDKEKTIEDVPDRLKKVVYDIGVKNAVEKKKAAIGQIAKAIEGGRARAEEGKSKTKKSKTVQKIKKTTPRPKAAVKKPIQEKAVVNPKRQTDVAPPAPEKVDLDSTFAETSDVSITQKASVLAKVEEDGNTASALTNGGFARGKSGLGAGGGGKSVGIGSLEGNMTGGGMGAGDYGLTPSSGRQIEIRDEEEVVVKGGLDPDVIAAIIKRYLPQIQHCYEQGLVSRPRLKGKVGVSFVITANGSVSLPKIIETTLGYPPTEKCILTKIKDWKFPRPKGGGTVGVKYPFILMSNTGN